MPKRKKPTTKPVAAQASHRKAVVFVSLVGVLTFTTALLLALAPAPLERGGTTLMNAAGTTDAPSSPHARAASAQR